MGMWGEVVDDTKGKARLITTAIHNIFRDCDSCCSSGCGSYSSYVIVAVVPVVLAFVPV